MTRLLLVNRQVPWPLDDGNALRVLELARHRDPDIECHLACLPYSVDGLADLEAMRVFDSITLLPADGGRRDWRRLLRWGNRNYYRIAHPAQFNAIQTALRQLVQERRIDILVAVLERCEECSRGLPGIPRIVDQYDCMTLAHERQLAVRRPTEMVERMRWQQRIIMAKSVEQGLGKRCDMITAIAPPDVARLQELNPGAAVVRVPNGISQELLDRRPAEVPSRRGVAFWGNLSFPVNRQAIEYFIARVWKPYLAAQNIEFVIIGPHAGRTLRAMVDEHPGVVLAGFVDDLFGFLDQFPIMVNPMVTGGGMKNKVLEAFATGRAVVTTSMGIDAFPEIEHGHCFISDDPGSQAAAIVDLLDHPARRIEQVARGRQLVERHYTWRAVGAAWSALIRDLAQDHARRSSIG